MYNGDGYKFIKDSLKILYILARLLAYIMTLIILLFDVFGCSEFKITHVKGEPPTISLP